MPKSLMMVLSNPLSPEIRDAFLNWYDTRHLPEVLNISGVVSATRYDVVHDVPIAPGIPTPSQSTLAIYELEADDLSGLRQVAENMQSALARGDVDVSPTLDAPKAAGFFALPASGPVDRSVG